jgi:hypothetical protein
MTLSNEQRLTIYCAALSAHIQAEAVRKASAGPNQGSGIGSDTVAEMARKTTVEVIAKIERAGAGVLTD